MAQQLSWTAQEDLQLTTVVPDASGNVYAISADPGFDVTGGAFPDGDGIYSQLISA